MKTQFGFAVLVIAALIASATAFAHGPIYIQTLHATTDAIQKFHANETPEVRRMFKEVRARIAPQHKFEVEIVLRDGAMISYGCEEVYVTDPTTGEQEETFPCTKR